MADAQKDETMKKKAPTAAIPTLATSPFAPMELVDHEDLSAGDREFLGQKEEVIEKGRKTFLEVGSALMEIRDYNDGILYKRYGNFDNYCTQRWEFGRSYAHRLMDAVGIYQKMLPRGDITEKTVMPTTEKQLRALSRLPTPKLQRAAWKAAVEAVGPNPIRTRDVEKEVRALTKSEGLEAPAAPKQRAAKREFYQIAVVDMAKIRIRLRRLRTAVSTLKDQAKIGPLIDEIEALLPGGGGSNFPSTAR